MNKEVDIPNGVDPWEFIVNQKQSKGLVSKEVRMLFADILERAGDSELVARFEDAGLSISEKPPPGASNLNFLVFRDRIEFILDGIDWQSEAEVKKVLVPMSHYLGILLKRCVGSAWVKKEFLDRLAKSKLVFEKGKLSGLVNE